MKALHVGLQYNREQKQKKENDFQFYFHQTTERYFYSQVACTCKAKIKWIIADIFFKKWQYITNMSLFLKLNVLRKIEILSMYKQQFHFVLWL